MKRYIHSETEVSMNTIHDAILAEFGRSEPVVGCSYIAKDGTFINIYPTLTIHEDLCDWVEDRFDIELDYKDEEYFIREFDWVRLRSDPSMSVIELTADMPTNSQWYSLEDWLYMLEERYTGRVVKVYVSVCDSNTAVDTPFELGRDYFAEDILKQLKKYYSTGRLYASTKCE